MKFTIITLFPESFDSYLHASILGRAIKNKTISVKLLHLREFARDKHKTVDDRVYGGGAGMLLKFEPLFAALKKAVGEKELKKHGTWNKKTKNQENKKTKNQTNIQIALLSAGGKTFDQTTARAMLKHKHIVLICGRYEGVDARIEKFIDQKISIGNFVLTGGELPALILVDSISRLIPGVVGNEESPKDESFSDCNAKQMEYPQYTRPEHLRIFNKRLDVPNVLLSGNHAKIKGWREKKTRGL